MATVCKLCNWEIPAGKAQFCDVECERAFLHAQCIRDTVSVPVSSSSSSPSAGSEDAAADQQQQYEYYLQLLTQLRGQQQQTHGEEENDGRVSPSLVDAVRDAAFRTHPWYYYTEGDGEGVVKGEAVVASVLLPMGTVLPLPMMASTNHHQQLLRCGAIDLPSSSTPASSSSPSSMAALVASLRELLNQCPLRRSSDRSVLFPHINGWMGMRSEKVKSLCTPSQWSTLFTAAATVVYTSPRNSSSTPAKEIVKQDNTDETPPSELIQKLVQTFLLMRCSAARMKRRRNIGAEVGDGDTDWVLCPSIAEIAHSCQARAVLEECDDRREASEEGQEEMGASSTVMSSSFRLRLMAPHRRYEAFTINNLLPFSALLWDTSRRQQFIVQQTGAICECARCVGDKEDLCRGFPCPLAPCQGTIFRKNETTSQMHSLNAPSLVDEPAWRCHRCHATWSDRDMSSRLSQEKDIVDRLEALRAQSRFHERNVFESLTEIANRCSHTLGDAHWASIAVCEVLLSFYSFLIGTRRFANETMEVAQQMLLRWLLRWAKLTRKLAYWRHCPAYVMQQLSFFSQLLRLPSCAFDVKKLTASVAAEIERGSAATSVDWLVQQPDESVTTLLTAWSDYLLKRMEEALNSARPEQAHPLLQRMMRGGGGSP